MVPGTTFSFETKKNILNLDDKKMNHQIPLLTEIPNKKSVCDTCSGKEYSQKCRDPMLTPPNQQQLKAPLLIPMFSVIVVINVLDGWESQ